MGAEAFHLAGGLESSAAFPFSSHSGPAADFLCGLGQAISDLWASVSASVDVPISDQMKHLA